MKRILVALDSSPRAPMVLEAAARLAELVGAKLLLFRAVTVPPDLPDDIFTVTDLRLEELLLGNARGDLANLAKQVPADRIEKSITTFATAWDGICRTARDENVDLIVIGSHGYAGLDRLLGTTASKVVNHADRNVLVVRAAV
ncbi:MAG TPA: universal stress protein [Kofleriaceae bacterium]|nr:universal stress protein [Kofleriaceae bacterium]